MAPQFIGIGYVVLALLMAYVYPIGYKGGSALMVGLKFGAIMGLIWIVPHSIVMLGVEGTIPFQFIAVDGMWHLVEQGAGGVVIAMLYGKGAGAGEEAAT